MDNLSSFLKSSRGDLSIREVARRTGISHPYLSQLENGFDPRNKKKREPSVNVFRRLSDYYEVNIIELMIIAGQLEEDDLCGKS